MVPGQADLGADGLEQLLQPGMAAVKGIQLPGQRIPIGGRARLALFFLFFGVLGRGGQLGLRLAAGLRHNPLRFGRGAVALGLDLGEVLVCRRLRGRSGLAAKYGVMPANGVGTIDADYRGEIGVILLNTSNTAFVVEPGMRIAQLVITRYERAGWEIVDSLDETERGSGGFGSTGK